MKIQIIFLSIATVRSSIADEIDTISGAFMSRHNLHVNLSYQGISYRGVRDIVKGLEVNPHVTSLDLSHNKIGAEGIAIIINASKTTAIADLNLGHNINPEIDNNIIFSRMRVTHELLATALNNTRMSNLSLAGNQINEKEALNIAKVLKNTKIVFLDLGQNQIGMEGGAAIIDALKTQMISLILQENHLKREGTISMVEALKYTLLTTLDFGNNWIGNYGTAAIANVLAETNITHLNLQSNGIDSEGASILMKVLPNTLITYLSIRNNDIEDEEVFHNISITLRHNRKRIHRLYMEFVDLVSVREDLLQFSSAERSRCIEFTHTISRKKQGHIRHFVAYMGASFTKYQIEEFIGNIETKLSDYLSSEIGTKWNQG